MDQDLKGKTLDNLTKAESILIAVSQNAGFDGLAAGLGLYLSCLKLGKNAAIQAPEPSVGQAQKLYAVDKIGKSQSSKNLVIVVKNAIDNVDKVTHSLEGNDLKLVLHALPEAPSISTDQISFENAPSKAHLIFAIGYDSPDQLKQEFVHEQNLDSDVWLVNINRQDKGQIFAQVNIFDDQASSYCEITSQLIADLALPVDEDIAYNLYSGIAQATNNFSPSHASPNSFQVAAWLLKFGAGRASFAQEGTQVPGYQQPQETPHLSQPPLPQQTSRDQSYQELKQKLMELSKNQTQEDQDEFGQQAYGDEIQETPIEQVEVGERAKKNWLKPPKIYKGSKSFDSEG